MRPSWNKHAETDILRYLSQTKSENVRSLFDNANNTLVKNYAGYGRNTSYIMVGHYWQWYLHLPLSGRYFWEECLLHINVYYRYFYSDSKSARGYTICCILHLLLCAVSLQGIGSQGSPLFPVLFSS